MKKSKKVLLFVLVALVCLTAIFLICEIPSEFGKRPYHDLSVSKIESCEVVQGNGYFDLWRAELDEKETENICKLLSQVRLRGKTDQTKHVLKDGEGGSGYEHFCLYLKDGSVIRVATEAFDQYPDDEQYFYIDFVCYDLEPISVNVCMELRSYHDQLLKEK